MSLPWFPFDTEKWLSDPKINNLSLDTQAILIKLLCLMWQSPDCRIPDNKQYIAPRIGLYPNRWSRVRQSLIDPLIGVLSSDGQYIFSNELKNLHIKAKDRTLKAQKAANIRHTRQRKHTLFDEISRTLPKVPPPLSENYSPKLLKTNKSNNAQAMPLDIDRDLEGDLNNKEYIDNRVNGELSVFGYWNKKAGVQKHRSFDAHRRAIRSALSLYSLEEIKIAIDRYSVVLCDKGNKYRVAYSWTLSQFLSRQGHYNLDRFNREDWADDWAPFGASQQNKAELRRLESKLQTDRIAREFENED